MDSKKLTRNEALLIQRHYDGECRGDERDTAQRLLDDNPAARVYLSALESLGEATRMAEHAAWQSADCAGPDELLELAESSQKLVDAPIDQIAPLLERYHDGELDDAERAVVRALAEQRDDVDDYLDELRALGECVRSIDPSDDVDFDDFWAGIEEGIDELEEADDSPVAVEAYDPERHQKLLMRFHDGEATERECRRVRAWIDSQDQRVEQALQALREVEAGVEAGLEFAVEHGEVPQPGDLDDDLDAIDAEKAADNVVSLSSKSDDDLSSGTNWMQAIGVAAAAVALLVAGALLGPQVTSSDDAPGADSEPVVVFDTVEPAPGSSVFIHSPEFADHDGADAFQFGPNVEPIFNEEPGLYPENGELDPTVLWIVDDEDEEDDEDDEDDDEKPEEETDELPGPI